MKDSYEAFAGQWGERARLALDAIEGKPTRGIPVWLVHVMDIPFMEEMTGNADGDFARDPDGVYLAFEKLAGVCYIDQYIPDNPLTMGPAGHEEHARRTVTTGAGRIEVDGIVIDSPEAVVEHLERFVFSRRERKLRTFDPDDPVVIEKLVAQECAVQRGFGPDLLKGPFMDGFQSFPAFHNYTYGYENYFMAYGLYPEIIERDFRQAADLAVLENRAAARAIIEGGLPRLVRLDYDMADSRGTLVNIRSLDRIWFPHFARAIKPFMDAGIRLIWHCDGNLMEMLPRLIEVGIRGFQGFQYEDHMDYERICRMTDREGTPLFIMAGASVTRTLPMGTREDVIRELKWLVDHGPRAGFMLGASSSIVPGTPRENIKALIEGLNHYRKHGREG
ncbi:MAG TPA: uroporphyrinogen decarboxylase family protein [Phycisphaerae bacterium]|nr:uroporphyrinogen decarboxylase family protein [Phycisphaerae bacterium]